ncbi:hypothetical protein, partial [Streptomyces sp. NPDC051014]|uniref:hypothetical protein n=1 Tax=Streptomyces sp. NPDC051014 TaxID=3155751 RepID=UPI0033E5E498
MAPETAPALSVQARGRRRTGFSPLYPVTALTARNRESAIILERGIVEPSELVFRYDGLLDPDRVAPVRTKPAAAVLDRKSRGRPSSASLRRVISSGGGHLCGVRLGEVERLRSD